MIWRLDSADSQFARQLKRLLDFDSDDTQQYQARVEQIIDQVRVDGDQALVELSNRFDQVNVSDFAQLVVSAQQRKQAMEGIDCKIVTALQQAARRIRKYAEHQKIDSWQYEEADGTIIGQQVRPLDSVGVYVPGGTAAYLSSVLMNVIPAQVAGVQRIVLVSPMPDKMINHGVLAAAEIIGVSEIYRIGGAQAIAALAYGTATISPVDKIVGPGNRFVALAKRQVFGQVGIDMMAGPSEVLIICDGTPPPDWIAMDLFAQAEHDVLAQAILLCPDQDYLDQVQSSIERLLPSMPRKDTICQSLQARGALIKTDSLDQATDLANQIAPEHLELAVEHPKALLERIRHAGAIFIGQFSAEVFGDYCAGPNHVLPTSGTARFSSPLGVYDFQKRSSLIHCSPQGASKLVDIASVLADSEGLSAHAHSARMRS